MKNVLIKSGNFDTFLDFKINHEVKLYIYQYKIVYFQEYKLLRCTLKIL